MAGLQCPGVDVLARRQALRSKLLESGALDLLGGGQGSSSQRAMYPGALK